MKLEIRLQAGSRTSEHQAELPAEAPHADGGQLRFILDGGTLETDWSEIAPGVYSVLLCGRSYEAQVATPPRGQPAGREAPYTVTVGTRHYLVQIRDPRRRRHTAWTAAAEGPQEILAPMPGKIVKLLVEENQEVSPGTGLLVIEAMKMQNELRAPRAGRVEKIHVLEGTGVESGSRLIRLA